MEEGCRVPAHEGAQEQKLACWTRRGVRRGGDLIRFAGESGTTDTRERKIRGGDRCLRLYGQALDEPQPVRQRAIERENPVVPEPFRLRTRGEETRRRGRGRRHGSGMPDEGAGLPANVVQVLGAI